VSEQPTTVVTVDDGIARITWAVDVHRDGLWSAVEVVRREVEIALAKHGRVETLVHSDDEAGQRVATWAGMRREGIMRGVDGDRIVYARLESDAPASEPDGFRALLNSFLPRKRAISQMLLRDPDDRVLLCQLTYKQDWDLPGGVVEVGESPQLAVSREVEEELGLTIEAGPLLLTDWLPPWGGWDDAVCLVFDGGRHPAAVVDSVVKQEREIRAAEFCTLEQVQERCADFTARRIAAALDPARPGYTESGR
jgi:8-oxo-dGTP pyrophosphatase MutT (NUDIX family)